MHPENMHVRQQNKTRDQNKLIIVSVLLLLIQIKRFQQLNISKFYFQFTSNSNSSFYSNFIFNDINFIMKFIVSNFHLIVDISIVRTIYLNFLNEKSILPNISQNSTRYSLLIDLLFMEFFWEFLYGSSNFFIPPLQSSNMIPAFNFQF